MMQNISRCTYSNFTVNRLWFREYENYGSLLNQQWRSIHLLRTVMYDRVISTLYSFAVVLLMLDPDTEVQEEDVGTVNLTITASKPAEFSYVVTINTMAGTAEG